MKTYQTVKMSTLVPGDVIELSYVLWLIVGCMTEKRKKRFESETTTLYLFLFNVDERYFDIDRVIKMCQVSDASDVRIKRLMHV